MGTVKYITDKAKSFVIVQVLNTPSSDFYFSSATQLMRMLSPEGLAVVERLIVPVINGGGKFLTSFEGTKAMIEEETENRAFPEPGTPEWLEDYGWWKPSPYELDDFFKLHKHLKKGFERRVDFKQGGEVAKQFKQELLTNLESLTNCSRFIADDILDVVKMRYKRE